MDIARGLAFCLLVFLTAWTDTGHAKTFYYETGNTTSLNSAKFKWVTWYSDTTNAGCIEDVNCGYATPLCNMVSGASCDVIVWVIPGAGYSTITPDVQACGAGEDPALDQESCDVDCVPPATGATSGDGITRLTYASTVAAIDSERVVTAASEVYTGSLPLCYQSCLWVGNFLALGARFFYVPDAENITIGSPLYVSSMYLRTSESCEVGDPAFKTHTNADGADDVTNGAGQSSGSGSGTLTNEKLEAIKANTGATGVLADYLKKIADSSKAEPGSTSSLVDCEQALTCTGDAARCAMLVYARESFCNATLHERGTGPSLQAYGQALVDEGAESLHAKMTAAGGTHNLGVHMNRERFLADTGCPAPLQFAILDQTFDVPFEPLCYLADFMAFALIVGASIVAFKIFVPAL